MNELETTEYNADVVTPSLGETLYVKYKLGGWRMMLVVFMGFIILCLIISIIIRLIIKYGVKKKTDMNKS